MYHYLVLAIGMGLVSAAPDSQPSTTDATVRVSGYVRTADGEPVPDISVQCFYFPRRGSDFPYQNGEQVTDENGRYEFQVRSGYEYYVEIAPRKSTHAKSDRFDVRSGQDVHVKDLVVQPARAHLKGRVVYGDGRPAAGMEFCLWSASFSPFRAHDYPKTDNDGLFDVPNTLPDEEIAFWVVPDANHIQLWTGVAPTASLIEFRLNPGQYEGMPPQWRTYEDAEASARHAAGTKVQKRIDFTLPSLDGQPVSLSSERFKGKVVLVNIFGSWCGGCRIEMPHLVRMQKKYASQGLEVIGLAFERETDLTELRKLMEEAKVSYPILLAGPTKAENVVATIKGIDRFVGYPTTILLGRDGQVRYTEVGIKAETKERTEWWSRRLEKKVIELLKNAP